jgi:hypothetical protein
MIALVIGSSMVVAFLKELKMLEQIMIQVIVALLVSALTSGSACPCLM